MHPDTIALAVLKDKLARIAQDFDKRGAIFEDRGHFLAAEVCDDIADTLKGLAKE